VVVSDALSVRLTGKKHEQKIYKHHSGFIGGLKEVPISRMRERRPEEVRHCSSFSLNYSEERRKNRRTRSDDRLSEERSLGCCPKTHSDKDVLID